MKSFLFILLMMITGSIIGQTEELPHKWKMDYGVDQDSGLNIVQAKLVSLNRYPLKHKPEEFDVAMLFIAQKRGTLIVAILTSYLEMDLSTTNQIIATFDNGDPVSFTVHSRSNDPNTIFIDEGAAFLNKLSSAESIKIESKFIDEEAVVFNFNNKGFEKIKFTDW